MWTVLGSMCRRYLISPGGYTEPLSPAYRVYKPCNNNSSLSPESLLLVPSLSLQFQVLSHAAHRASRPSLGLRCVSRELGGCPWAWRFAHHVGTNSQPVVRVTEGEWHRDSQPLELPPSHESYPTPASCYRREHGLYREQWLRESPVGTASAAFMDANFRYLDSKKKTKFWDTRSFLNWALDTHVVDPTWLWVDPTGRFVDPTGESQCGLQNADPCISIQSWWGCKRDKNSTRKAKN